MHVKVATQTRTHGASGAAELVLEARGLSAGYGHMAVVRDLDLTLCRGEIVALFGPNGAGKTTTISALAGALPVMRGEVRWMGKVSPLPLHRRVRQGLALVPEKRSVLASLSVRDNLLLGAGGVDPAIELFPELRPLLRRNAGLLSGGEQQILACARALAAEPSVLLIDELSLGLAPLVVERLLGRLKEIVSSRDVAVLLVEQQARRALKIADRWYLMRHGSIVGEGDSLSGAAGLEAAYLSDVQPG